MTNILTDEELRARRSEMHGRRVGVARGKLMALAREICGRYGLRIERVIGPGFCCVHACAVVRQEIIREAVRRFPRASYSSIAAVVGCYHTTVLYAISTPINSYHEIGRRQLRVIALMRQGVPRQAIALQIGTKAEVLANIFRRIREHDLIDHTVRRSA